MLFQVVETCDFQLGMQWECDHLQILRIVTAGIALSSEFSEVIEAVELCFENLKKKNDQPTNQPSMNVRKKYENMITAMIVL